MPKVSQKFNQREVTQKVRKGEQLFLHATRCLDLIYIAIKFHQDISYSHQVMVHTERPKKGSNSEIQKMRAIILYTTYSFNLILIALKFHRGTVTYLWYPQGQSKISSKGSNSETEKGGATIFSI